MRPSNIVDRRQWLQAACWSPALAGFVSHLPSIRSDDRTPPSRPPQRIVWMFSPNGVVQEAFWPKVSGSEFECSEILAPLAPFRQKTIVLKGIDNRVRGDGDDHMRGMSCLLTGVELFPGNIQGGGNTPAGWPQGPSIDQVLRQFLQSRPETRTRFGSLELGVLVPDRADVWTRWVYSGPNRPVTPISNPRHLYQKIFGDQQDIQLVKRVTDLATLELQSLQPEFSHEDRDKLDQHLQSIREIELRLEADSRERPPPAPQVMLDIPLSSERMPEISALQQDLLVSAFSADQARLATLQYDTSVGNIKMTFLGIQEGHHELSHDPDGKQESQQKLIRINRWYCEQLARLVSRLEETPEPSGQGSLLDHTTVIWTNELGKGNSHTLNDIPMVLVGGGLGLRQPIFFQFNRVAHNRLWLTFAETLGHHMDTFGNPNLCRGGILNDMLI